MKFSNLFWALILIAIGLLFLFSNFGWVDFNWSSIWRLWPLVLIFWGISILPVRDLVKSILVIGIIAISFIFFKVFNILSKIFNIIFTRFDRLSYISQIFIIRIIIFFKTFFCIAEYFLAIFPSNRVWYMI